MLTEVTTSDWLNVLAILLSPLIALQVGKFLDSFSNKKRRKEEIFNTLMETRAQTLSYEHVRALNKIDVAFYKDKKVRVAGHLTETISTLIQTLATKLIKKYGQMHLNIH